MKLTRLVLPVALLALGLTASAQEKKTMRLSLMEAQQYAVEHNRTMLNADLDVKKAEVERWKTIASMLPQVKAGFDYQNMCGYEMVMGSGATAFHISMDPNATLSVQAAVALTGAQIVGVMLQNISSTMTDISRQQTEQQTRSQVKNVYVSILVMEQTTTLLDSSLANIERLAATSERAVEVGAAEQVDADKLQVQVATMRSNINSTRRSLEALRNSMLLQLGADVDSKLELTTSLDEVLSVDQAMQLLGQGFDIRKNYSYQLLEQSEAAARRNVTMAWMNYTPTLSAYYQYSNKVYFGEAGMNMTPPNMVGVNVSLPIFSSGANAMGVKSAKIDLQESMNSKQQAEDGLQVQYNQLRYDLASALETYTIQRDNLDVTQRVFNNVSEKYRYGRASSLEVTNASTDIISAQSSYIQAVMSVVTAQSELENLLNKD